MSHGNNGCPFDAFPSTSAQPFSFRVTCFRLTTSLSARITYSSYYIVGFLRICVRRRASKLVVVPVEHIEPSLSVSVFAVYSSLVLRKWKVMDYGVVIIGPWRGGADNSWAITQGRKHAAFVDLNPAPLDQVQLLWRSALNIFCFQRPTLKRLGRRRNVRSFHTWTMPTSL